jgi:glycosyltransferase involved in cell wall biosynthesis
MIKVGFWFDAPFEYTGGLNYIANLLHALNSVNRGEVRPYVFFANNAPDDVVRRFERYATVILTPILQRKTFAWFIHKLAYKLFGSMVMVNVLLKKQCINVLSHAWTPYLGRRPLKVISWIPDFQYLHLPEMFPNLDADRESRINRQIATHADAVIVSSVNALGDLLGLLSGCAKPPVEVLRFVSQPFTASNQILPSLDQLKKKYCIPGKFFVLPNQFWAHKNHEVVLRALALAKNAGLSMTVLMTGNTKDYRLKGAPYFDGLRDRITELGIHNEARILGLIDYNDLLVLMRTCVGFINPSRFEGWSSSVEEAKSLGKPILMSRIPVHIEQAPAHGAYFDCDDADKLCELMWDLWTQHESVDQTAREKAALDDLYLRTEAFGRQYISLIKRVAAETV